MPSHLSLLPSSLLDLHEKCNLADITGCDFDPSSFHRVKYAACDTMLADCSKKLLSTLRNHSSVKSFCTWNVSTLPNKYYPRVLPPPLPPAEPKVVLPASPIVVVRKKDLPQSPWKMKFLVKLVSNKHEQNQLNTNYFLLSFRLIKSQHFSIIDT